MTEYSCRLANVALSVHVIQMDDWIIAGPNWKAEFHEMVLRQRRGRKRLTYVCNPGDLTEDSCITKLRDYFKKCRAEYK